MEIDDFEIVETDVERIRTTIEISERTIIQEGWSTNYIIKNTIFKLKQENKIKDCLILEFQNGIPNYQIDIYFEDITEMNMFCMKYI